MDIDIVIAWVDGSDPNWQAERSRFAAPSWDAGGTHRYRDHGLLRWWFRGVERFAPWVRKIHFVTWGHVPPFLDAEAPKLHIVRHADFIPAQYLPTFSSHVIEANLHRISGLSEHFLYFNDDMFLLREVAPRDFFREGLPCLCGCEIPWAFSGDTGIWAHAAANGLGVINRRFPKKEAVRRHRGKYLRAGRWQDGVRTLGMEVLFPDVFTGFRNVHGPSAFRIETFQEVWAAEPELLEATCRKRFRSASDVNQWVFLWWQIASGGFYHHHMDNLVGCICEGQMDALCRAIEGQTHDCICLNDSGGDITAEIRHLQRAFNGILPEKSGFEK